MLPGAGKLPLLPGDQEAVCATGGRKAACATGRLPVLPGAGRNVGLIVMTSNYVITLRLCALCCGGLSVHSVVCTVRWRPVVCTEQ